MSLVQKDLVSIPPGAELPCIDRTRRGVIVAALLVLLLVPGVLSLLIRSAAVLQVAGRATWRPHENVVAS